MNKTTAYLGLGSNLGDREQTIRQAIEQLSANPQVQLEAASSLITTEAQGGPDHQPDFLNGAVKITTTLTADELLELLLQTEDLLGRIRQVKWGPRTIDLDLLLFGDNIIETPRLNVPHPLMHLRRFVLQPLAQIAPDILHPQLRKTIQTLLDGLEDA